MSQYRVLPWFPTRFDLDPVSPTLSAPQPVPSEPADEKVPDTVRDPWAAPTEDHKLPISEEARRTQRSRRRPSWQGRVVSL